VPDLGYLVQTRLQRPEAIAEAATARARPAWPPARLLVIAADHTARGIVEAGGRPMTDRGDLLDRLVLALSRPGVDGVLGTRTSSRICCCSARSSARSCSAR
jgi:hypothetical protein